MKSGYFVVFALFAALLRGQSTPPQVSTNGWNLGQTIDAATDIAVADLVDGFTLDSGATASGKATIQVARVLQGSIREGSTLNLEWTYKPLPITKAANVKLPAIRTLLFLKQSQPGVYEPLRSSLADFGGVFVEVSRNPSPYADSLPPNASLQTKLAWELGWAIEDDVRLHGMNPNPSGVQTSGLPSLVEIVGSLQARDAIEVYKRLAMSSDPTVKLLGLVKRINALDPQAALELEKELPALTPAFNRWHWISDIQNVNLSKDPQSLHALGRVALSDNTLPGMDVAFSMMVRSTRNLEFLPYLAVMLKSVDTQPRDFAMEGICNLLSPPGVQRKKAHDLWQPEMDDHCPTKIPYDDHPKEQRDVEYWQRWWDSSRAQIATLVALPNPNVPARYNQPPANQMSDLRPEDRFQVALRMATLRPATRPGVPPMPDPVGSKMNSKDRETWTKLVESTNARLDALRKKADDIIASSRLQGVRPARELGQSLDREQADILRDGLQEAERSLSKAGWAILQQEMSRGAGARMTITRPTPPQPVPAK